MKIYTDGACSGNPGPGGYAIIGLDDAETHLVYKDAQYEDNTTNNIQELKALIHTFAIATARPDDTYYIFSDSAYAINVFTLWAPSWKRNGWTKSDNKPIKNLELIQKGLSLYENLTNCHIVKVAGHADHLGNELADALASQNENKWNKYYKQLEDRSGQVRTNDIY